MRKILTVIFALVFTLSSGYVAYSLVDDSAAEDTHSSALEIALADSEVIPEEIPEEIPDEADEPALDKVYPESERENAKIIHETLNILDEPVPMAEVPEIPQEPIPEEALFLLDLDLAGLQEVNSDVMGWIDIPGGEISHPLMRSHDNAEYLSHAWDGTKSRSGAIFLERKNSAELTDFHSLIYGHNMRNNKFFAPLHSYKEPEYRDAHPYVYVRTETELLQYEVFAVYTAKVVSNTYRLYFPDDEIKQESIDYYLDSARYDTGVEVTTEDRILTLSTCTKAGDDDKRWVVQTVLTQSWAIEKEPTEADS